MAIRKRKKKLQAAPARKQATDEHVAAGNSVDASGAWTWGGGLLGGIAGGALGGLATGGNPLGANCWGWRRSEHGS